MDAVGCIVTVEPDTDRAEHHMAAIGVDCHYATDSVHFTFQGHDEMTEVSGDGEAELQPDGTSLDIQLPSRRRSVIHRQTMVNFRSLLGS